MIRNRGQPRAPSFAILLLIHELFRTATTYGIPTVTLATIVSQVLIHLHIIPLPMSSVWDVCLSYESIVQQKQYLRLLLSQLTHGDDWHLYYNMVSFLWKGRTLEVRLGSVRFATTLIVFTISTAFTYVLTNRLIADVIEDHSYLYHCSVGFSGVIFALKVLTTHYNDNNILNYFGFIPIAAKYAVWAELFFIQMVSPNASFVGHLAGILVGFAYIYGPLYYIIELITNIFNALVGNSNTNYQSYERRGYSNNTSQRYTTSGRSGYSNHTDSQSTFQSNYATYSPSGMSEEEQLRRAYEESINDYRQTTTQPTAPPDPNEDNFPQHLNPEQLRQLRLRRYQN
ncbi:rhomboid-related protein 4-like [Oppia nitens]|uniref:rhomboid-related protein 4-like n=1 Tax=Oppia nitens TaxID=1686743 RepID=UPI0023DB7239|nr:rhomboid-related protein 4-like [Oppia nitens]